MNDERYEIRGKIGQGGVGAVYRAFDRNLNREVAIKRVLTEEGFDPKNEEDGATRALLQEATALCSVQHPHIVTVYDAGADEDGPYVIMELLSGRTLDEMIERGTMTWGDFRETAVQSLEALIAAQDLDLVHRDIKPSNVMVTWLPSGKFQVKLVDFGLAKFSAAPSLQTIDHSDSVFGSIHFMAPEQFERVPLDKRTDMYSLGCVFFFCLTGNYPFDGETAPQVMAAHLQNTFTPLQTLRPDLPDWVCQWVEWFLARQPDDRPTDAREALERFLSFEKPPNADTAPVHVQAVSASSLATPPSGGSAESRPPSRMTGPIPLHVTGPTPVMASRPAPAKLNTGPVFQQPELALNQGNPPEERPQAANTPRAFTPPEGSKPSIHTGSQVMRASSHSGPVPLHTTSPTPVENTVPQPPTPPTPEENQHAEEAPAPAPPEAPAAHVPQTGLRSTAAKATLITFLVLGIIIAAVVLYARHVENEKQENIQRLLNLAAEPGTSEIAMDGDDVDDLLAYARDISFSDNKLAVYQALYLAEATDSTPVDQRIARYAIEKSMNEEVRTRLFQVVGRRGDESAVSLLVDYAQDGDEPKAVVAAIEAARGKLDSRDLKTFYSLIASSESREVRAAAERAVKKYLLAQQNIAVAIRDLLAAYENASEPESQRAYLRLLGASSSDRARDVLLEALESEDESLQVAAYSALADWQDTSFFDTHLSGFASEESTFVRGQAFESLLAFLTEGDKFEGEKASQMWNRVAEELRGRDEKMKFINQLARQASPWRITLAESFENDPDDEVSFLAEKAIESMTKRLE